MNPVGQLFHRLGYALGTTDVEPEERQKIIDAWADAGGENGATWEKLPKDIQQLVTQIEGRERQSWDDPADLPDQKNL